MAKATAEKPAKKGGSATSAETNGAAPRGLSESKLKVLKELNKAGDRGLTRAELAERTGINKGWAKMLGAVTKGDAASGTLEGDGYVRSEPAAEGERGIRYYITAKGKKALGK